MVAENREEDEGGMMDDKTLQEEVRLLGGQMTLLGETLTTASQAQVPLEQQLRGLAMASFGFTGRLKTILEEAERRLPPSREEGTTVQKVQR